MQADIGIIGAGPAGLTTALFLAKAGIPHVLIDRADFPRDKICGESYDGKVFHTLRRLRPNLPEDLVQEGILRPAHRYTLTMPDGFCLPISFSPQSTPRLQGRRREFDARLLQTLLEMNLTHWYPQTRVRKYQPDGDYWQVTSHNGRVFRFRQMVYAGGVTHRPSFLPTRTPKGDRLLFFRRYYHGLTQSEDIAFFLIPRPVKTCLVICPLPGGLFNVEIGLRQKDYIRLQQPLSTWLSKIIQHPLLADRLATAKAIDKGQGTSLSLHQWSGPLSGKGWLLAGSAAIQVNPITGMGVGNAMLMGRLAAKHLTHWSRQKDSGPADGIAGAYDREVRKSLRQEIRFSRWVTLLQQHHSWVTPLIRWLGNHPRVQHWLQQPDLVREFSYPAFYRRR